MSSTIATGEYLVDYLDELSQAYEKVKEAGIAAENMTRLACGSIYKGGGSNDLNLYTSSMDSCMVRMEELYEVGCRYLYQCIQEMNYTNEKLNAIVDRIGVEK